MRHYEGPICRQYKSERGAHHFCRYNNMDPGEKPHILRVLTQAEEMLIEPMNPILQVTHARCGQYKYSGHTISFPQDISTIIQSLPRHVEDIEILIVRRHAAQSKYYACYVKRSRVIAAFLFKIQHDQYYQDVVIDYDSVNSLLERSIDASSRLEFVDCDIEESKINEANNEGFPVEHFPSHPSTFVSCPPNKRREVEEIRAFLDNVDS